MSVEEIMPTHIHALEQNRVPRWFEYNHQARQDVVRSAQGAADMTGEPQFLVDGRTNMCHEMVISDTRHALAVAPGRFARYFAEQARAEALAEQATTTPVSDGAGDPP